MLTPSSPSNEAGPSRPRANGTPIVDDRDPFASLPSWNPAAYEPPPWASEGFFANGHARDKSGASAGVNAPDSTGDNESDGEDEAEEDWQDAVEKLDIEDEEAARVVKFTTEELRRLLAKATELKVEGNEHFTSKPPRHSDAVDSYETALKVLPTFDTLNNDQDEAGSKPMNAQSPPLPKEGSGVQELSDAEAAALEAELASKTSNDDDKPVELSEEEQRKEVEEQITDTRKACLGNLGACFLAMERDKDCVDVCTQALKIDSKYVKALQRRATANERIGKWSSLESAQEDYNLLLTLLPRNSPHIGPTRRALASLPPRIAEAQQRDKDELMAMAKNAGNTVLGWFGMSMDNIKFEEQPGGGYGVKIER